MSRLKYNWLHENIVTVSTSIRQTLIQGGVSREPRYGPLRVLRVGALGEQVRQGGQ